MRTSLRMWSAPAPGRGLRSWWLPVLLWLASVSAWAQTATIGSTTIPVASPATASYLYGPIYRSANDAGSTFNYSRYAYLYTPAELGVPSGSVITELAWLKSDAGEVTGSNTFTLWLENSTTTTLGTTQTWSAISATPTQVYTSTTQQVTGAAGTYFAVTLSQPFTYTGGNLLVLTDWVKQGTASAAVNFVTNAATGFGLGAANSTALTGTTALTTTYGNRRPTLRVTYAPSGPCTAPPTAGTTIASLTSTCSPTSVSFGLQGATFGTGMTYQWQSSTNGTTYTNISGATSLAYSTVVSATTYFRAVVTCSGQSANSTPVQVTVTAPTYATLPYSQGFDNAWVDVCATRDAPSNNWRMTASATDPDASWRRDDDGAAGSWTSPTFGAYTPASSQGTNSARFHSSYGTSGTVGTLDLYVNLSAAGTKQLNFDYINTSGTDSLTVHLSTDGGVTFGPALLGLRNTTTWAPQVLTLTSTSATAVIRFRGRSDFGSTDIGIDNLNLGVVTACTTPPAAGTAVASLTNICAPTAVDLSLTGISPAVTGLTYQWQSSTNGTTYTNISGATSPTYTTALVSATTYFRAVVTCSGQSANSTPVQVTLTAPAYATLPYAQNFDNAWVDVCATRDVPSNNWRAKAAPTDADASWRRDDDGAAGGWTGPTSGAYTPAFSQGTNSARFHTYNATSGTVGTLDLYVNMSAAGTKQLTFDFINTTGSDSLTVHLSTDGGVTFGPALLRLNTASAWTARAVSFSSTSATAVIRFRGRSDFGTTDIGLDNVNLTILPNCTTPPTAGTAVASVTNICAPTAVNLSLTGIPASSGLTYQWQSSTNGTTYTNISGATNPTYSAPVSATTYYRAVVTCSGQSANSTPVQVTLNAPTYATLPGLENFDNAWIDVCATREVPSNSWRMTASAADADASWRRDDDGAAGNWTSPTFGAYTPAFSQGTNSARFHSSYGSSGTVGTLDYYVNLSASGNKRLTFDYINTSGTDSLTVHLSTDGGVTFGPALLRLNTAAAWTNQALPITTTSATAVIRFRGRSDFGSTDIGIDNVRVESVSGCLSPAGLTVGTTTSTTAVLNWVNSGSGNYTVEYGPIGFSLGSGTQVTGITGTTTTLTGLTPGTPYQFYVIQNCGSTTSAAGGPVVFNTQITNDDPAGAITLNVGTACTPVSGTNVGATTTTANGYANPGSSTTGCGSASAPKDVWYKFTTAASGPTSTAVRITVTGTPASQVRAFSASSAAGPFTQIGCSANSSTSVAPNLDLTALSPSTTYYVRVSGFANADAQGAFTICAALLPNCQDPVVPTVSSTTSSTASIYWGGVQTSGSTYELEYGPQGFTLGSGTRINGIAGQTATLSTLTASTNYCFYVRQNCGTVNGFSAWVGPTCFTTDAGAATNDEPCNALPFTINGTGVITNLVGTTLGATTTVLPGVITPACSPALSPKDVWFRITLPAGVTSLSGNFQDNTTGMVRLFTAATCSTGFSQVACSASGGNNQAVGSVNFTGLTSGTTYYLAVSGYGSNDTRGQFSIIIQAQKNQLAGGDVAIFPNPVVGGAELNVQISGAKSGALHCEILNALGQVVQTRTAEVRNGNLQQTLTTTGLAKGLYQVRLRIGSEVMVQKVMVD